MVILTTSLMLCIILYFYKSSVHQIQIQCVYFLKEKLWCWSSVTPGLLGEAAAGTCDQHTNTTGPLDLLPVYSAVLYSTHCTVPRRDVWPVSALCQAALLWLPLSLAHWHMDELLISSCNHNLVFFNLYDDIHQIQYSEKAPTTAHFILERSGVLSTRRTIGTFSKCCVLGTRLSGTYFSSHKPQTTEAWLHCLCFSIWRVTHNRSYWTKFVSSAPPNLLLVISISSQNLDVDVKTEAL